MNESRRHKKGIELGDYHYNKGNYIKALESYFRAIRKVETKERLFLDISYCYEKYYQIDSAMKFVDIALIISPYFEDALKQKIDLLKEFGEEGEDKKFEDKIKKIAEESKNVDLDNLFKN